MDFQCRSPPARGSAEAMDAVLLRDRPEPDGVAAVLALHAASVDRDASFPWASIEALHAEGVLGLTARRDEGGQQAGLAEVAGVITRAGRGCASTALILAMQFIHVR